MYQNLTMAISDIFQHDSRHSDDDDRQSCQDDNYHHRDDDRQPSPGANQPISINRLAALHSREQLLVHPLVWTDRQPTLFGCRIHFRGEGGVVEDRDDRKCASDGLVALLNRRLNRHTYGDEFQDTIWKLFKSVSSNVSVNLRQTHEVCFYFNQRPCAVIPIYYFKIKALQVACIETSEIDQMRRNAFSIFVRRGPVTNWPGLNRYKAFCKRYQPPSAEKDPYLVALIIGLAQTQRGGARELHPPARGYYTVRVLFAGTERPSPLHVFVAHVTPAFLEQFDFPAQAPSSAAGLDIHHWRISPHPLETLPHRLLRCLKHECCGERHSGGGDRGSGSVSAESQQKRKRDADEDCAEAPLPKR